MVKRKITHLDKVISFKKRLVEVYPVDRLILFGSRARNRHTRYSDFDFVVVSRKFKGLDRLERSARMYDFWTYMYPAEFLCYTPGEFKRLKRRSYILKEALSEGIEL